MSDPTTIVRTYIEMWNETDPEDGRASRPGPDR